jgi:hypothetical protein
VFYKRAASAFSTGLHSAIVYRRLSALSSFPACRCTTARPIDYLLHLRDEITRRRASASISRLMPVYIDAFWLRPHANGAFGRSSRPDTANKTVRHLLSE